MKKFLMIDATLFSPPLLHEKLSQIFLNETIVGILIGGILTFLGTLLGTYLTNRNSKRMYKDSLTFKIITYFNSPEFLYVLQVLQKIKYEIWEEKEGKLIVNFFVPGEKIKRPKENKMENGLTPHQNLTLYLRFIKMIYWYIKDNSINTKLIEKMIVIEHYTWHHAFFKEFMKEYKKTCKKHKRQADKATWYIALKEFNRILDNEKRRE